MFLSPSCCSRTSTFALPSVAAWGLKRRDSHRHALVPQHPGDHHDDDGVLRRGGTSDTSATDTDASTAMALTRALLDAVVRTSAANDVTRSQPSGVTTSGPIRRLLPSG
jgi:hypothetical protein